MIKKLLYAVLGLVTAALFGYGVFAFFDIFWWIRSGGQEGG